MVPRFTSLKFTAITGKPHQSPMFYHIELIRLWVILFSITNRNTSVFTPEGLFFILFPK